MSERDALIGGNKIDGVLGPRRSLSAVILSEATVAVAISIVLYRRGFEGEGDSIGRDWINSIERIRFFRVVHAPLFFKHFASDRRHMKEPDGSWTAQPPPYEPIVAEDTLSSLDPETVRTAISMKLGVVVSHTQLQDLFTKLP